MTFWTILRPDLFSIAFVISVASLTGILQHMCRSSCPVPSLPALNFSYYCPQVLHPCSDRLPSAPWLGLCLSPVHCLMPWCSRARLWPSELLCVILAIEGNGRRSMWWMLFMRAQYRWLDGCGKGEHQPEYITATPFSLIPLHVCILSFIHHSVSFFPPPCPLQLS